MTSQRPSLPDDEVLREILRRLVAAFQPEQVYLFGSKARSDAGPDSDYDLMIVVPDEAPPEKRRSRLAYQALRGTRAAADVLVWTREAFDSRLHLPASLPATIIREGKLVYAA
ncbi:MAG: nucleotidyltransferase domain-containing protein [Deltaproteobacteria bacterium]|nr:nucleotidyltransferase domain-containing protein [Deltaproteobacteria bacterium]MBI4794281.1 nucleotidyltransferase domain-containing protein [Deltaproteobacteria bacterium]